MSAASPAESPPRSSLLPWLMWGLGALFYTYGFFQRVAPSVMVAELMRDFAVGAAITGTLSSLYFYTYAGLQIPVGLMLDRFGPRRVLLLACLFSAAGSAFFASATGLLPAYVGRAMIGAGAAVSWVGALKLASLWFPPRRFALLTGLTMAFGMAGAVGGQAPLSAAVAAFGWRGTLYFAAVMAIILGVLVWALVRDRGTQPVHAAPPKDGALKPRLLDGLKVVLRTPQTWWTSLFGAMMSAPMLAFAALWGVPYMMDVHALSKEGAALGTSLMLVGWGIGSPLVGWASDHFGTRRKPMLVTALGALACTTAWLYGDLPLGAVYTLQFLTGVFSGGIVVFFAAVREHNLVTAAGAALGVANMLNMSTGAVFQPLVGWMLDLRWDGTLVEGARVYGEDAWMFALIVLPACQALSLIGAVMVRETHCQPVKMG